ncbi:PaaI family thioesterase [Pseudonocardia halophobica]|uniref:Acyl-coenzyme A thioesterase THEM4 n=1 Tax=Pseudonocardia halophobica TaxID=29401 RepID=A0A9W6P139_9PSEU|nr:PaaI family thioesterase [Pseudonocardia halophobica]GLL15835.1 aromatic compound degradation protein PaaI [Pseudonocardia halophobica]
MTAEAALPPSRVEVRRELTARVGAAIRDLGQAFVASEVSEAELEVVLRSVNGAVEALRRHSRSVGELSSVDDPTRRIRMFNPVSGVASPIAPPLHVDPARSDRMRCTATTLLGPAHEGPFSYAHGGVVSALLDDVLGRVGSTCAAPVVTSRLNVRYRKPVPLEVPLVVTGTVAAIDGRRLTLHGVVATQNAPHVVLAEAEGWFVTLSTDQVATMYGSERFHEPRDG